MKQNFRCHLQFSKSGDKLPIIEYKLSENIVTTSINVEVITMELASDLDHDAVPNKVILNVNQDVPLPDFFAAECYGVFCDDASRKLHVDDQNIFKLLLFRNPNDTHSLKVKVDEPNLLGTISWQ